MTALINLKRVLLAILLIFLLVVPKPLLPSLQLMALRYILQVRVPEGGQ